MLRINRDASEVESRRKTVVVTVSSAKIAGRN
jgi:hypothetical protein